MLRELVLEMLVAFIVFICPCELAGAAQEVVWQIGKFDQSSAEFHQGEIKPPNVAGTQRESDVLFIVGKSNPASDWPAFQPGSANGGAGFRPHPYTVEFDLPGAPQGLYTLKVALLVETPRVSRLQIQINGHRALLFQQPALNYAGGDVSSVFQPAYSADTITVDLPTDYLNEGANQLVLTAVDEPAERDDVTNPGIFYDALELDHDPDGKFLSGDANVQAQPTVFYRQSEGKLVELVDVFIRHNCPSEDGQVQLTVGKEKFEAKLDAGWDFGDQRVEFEVPEFDAHTKGDVTVSVGGHTKRFPVVLDPAKKWNLFIVPHTHLDVGYTDYQAKVAEAQSRTLDEAIQMILDHPEFRFSPDGFWCVRQFLAGRSEDEQRRLFQMVEKKKIFVPSVEASLLTGFPGLETLLRSLYPGFQFNHDHGGDGDYADITDVPSYSWSYASVLAAAGLKYFAAGSDNYRAPVLLQGHLHEKSPFWWEGPDGGRILMWYSRHYHQVLTLFGIPPQIAGGRDSLPRFLQIYSRPEYKSDAVVVYGTQVENTDLFPQQATLAAEWNKIYAYPRLSYSGFSEALRYIANQFGDAIPVVRGDGGPYWEDGIISTARSAALERETEQRALAAEKFSTLSSLVNPRLQPEDEALKRLWQNMVLYDEHTWGAAGSESNPHSQETVGQWSVKEAFAAQAKKDVDYVLRRGMAALADYIYDPEGTLLVFNPLSWQRSGLIEMDLDKGLELADPVTRRVVPYEVLSTGPAYRRVRFLAQNVPSVGYKAYALKESKAEPVVPQAVSRGALENQYYRVTLDPDSGAVKSIYDKELNQELVNASSPYAFDQYLYVTGADQTPNRLIQYSPAFPVPELTVHNSSEGRLLSVAKQPFGIVAHLESSAVSTPRIETEVILFNGRKEIEFINRVHKTEVYTKEGVYFAFPLAMDHPQFHYEIQNGIVDPSRDQLPGAGKEWFSVQHWVAAEQGGVTAALVPVDAPLVALGDIVRGTWPLEFGQRPGTIFSYVMDNYWDTNYAAGQGGDFTFRYVLTSGNNLEPGYLGRLGREEMSPLEIDQITSQDKAINSPRPLDAFQASFLQVKDPDAVLVTWKRAEDGQGTILRFVEVAGKESEIEVQTPLFQVKSAWLNDALERKQEPLPVIPYGFKFSVKPFQIVTVRLEAAANLK
jgi:hypothetical protein